MHKIELLAEVSIARGCGFAALAIVTLMLGLSWDMALATEVGGILGFGLCLILAYKAQRALTRPVSQTELWMMLDRADRPHPQIAQRTIGQLLQLSYLRFASHAAAVSIGLLALSLGLQFLGQRAGA